MNNTSHHQHWLDVPAILITILMLLVAALRVVVTEWTPFLEITVVLSFFGVIAGIIFAISKFPGWFLSLFAVVFGVFLTGLNIGLTYDFDIDWTTRIDSISLRAAGAIQALVNNNPVFDSILFLITMGVLFWVLGSTAGYYLVRYANPWPIIMPAGLTLLVIHINDPAGGGRSAYLGIFLFLSLFILSRLYLLTKRAAWKKDRVHFPGHIGVDFGYASGYFAIVILFFIWVIPAQASYNLASRRLWNRVSAPYNDVRDRLENAFAGLQASLGDTRDYYGDSLSLGRGNTLSDELVLTILAPAQPPAGDRYYWRARVYPRYQFGGWLTDQTSASQFEPDAIDLNFPEDRSRVTTMFSVTPAMPISVLYSAPQPLSVNVPSRVEYYENIDGTQDLLTVETFPAIKAGEPYQVTAAISSASQYQLRTAGSEYPDWVKFTYLQIPTHITERTTALAAEIASPYDNPYDIAVAVTDYLRTNITYEEIIPEPPAEQDLVDWLLFDSKVGFCNYYATAEIILLRSLGIPARLAVGYAQGDWDEESSSYLVRQNNAHAWPEVYFPNYGWIEFEPTGSENPIIRPVGAPRENNNNQPVQETPDVASLLDDMIEQPPTPTPEEPALLPQDLPPFELPRTLPKTVVIISILTVILLLLAILSIVLYLYMPEIPFDQINAQMRQWPIWLETSIVKLGLNPPSFLRRWAFMARLPAPARAYQVINSSLLRLGHPQPPNATPAERAEILARLLPEVADPIKKLLREYETTIYSSTPWVGSEGYINQIAQSIRRTARDMRIHNFLEGVKSKTVGWFASPADPPEED